MRLTGEAIARYRAVGHVTIEGVFGAAEMDAAAADIERWGEDFLAHLPEKDRAWYIDGGVKARTVLRKLDDPAFHRPAIRALAADPRLVEMVEQLIGSGVSVCFSQIFFKAPEGGGPKPMHQDNYYFGPNDRDGVVTAWIAFDDAGLENGCLHFGEGTNLGPVYDHVAPPGEPYNLQIPAAIADCQPMTAAPVPKGGVSFHHGNTFHRSGPNLSARWRRACAVHYVNHSTVFATPALPYDSSRIVRVS